MEEEFLKEDELYLVYSGTVGYVGKLKNVIDTTVTLKETLRFIEMSVPTGQGTYGKVQSLSPVIGNYNKFPDVLIRYDSIIKLQSEMELYKYYEEMHAQISGIILPKNKLII